MTKPNRAIGFFTAGAFALTLAATIHSAVAEDGIQSEALPAPPPVDSASPTALAPPPVNQTLPVSPNEGPQEKALDQSLGLAPATSAGVPRAAPASAPESEADLEARINAAARQARRRHPPAPPASSTTAQPAVPLSPPSRWEGPEERALDRDLNAIDAGQAPPDSTPAVPAESDLESNEVKHLNGGQ